MDGQYGSNEGNGMGETDEEEWLMAFQRGGLCPAEGGQSLMEIPSKDSRP